MPFGITDAQEATSLTDEFLKLALVGEPGIGKSWLVCTAPKPIWNIDFDGRKSSLAGKEGVYVTSYADPDPNAPTATAKLEADLGLMEYEKQKGNPIPATFILDSLTYCRAGTEREIIKQQSTLSRPIKIGAKTLKIGQGYDIINGNRAYIEYLIARLSALGHLIVNCHTYDEKDTVKSTKEEKKFTGRKTIQPQYLAPILSTFNDVWLLDANWKNERVIHTGITDKFIGKNSLGLDAEIINPNIEQLMNAHKAKMQANSNNK